MTTKEIVCRKSVMPGITAAIFAFFAGVDSFAYTISSDTTYGDGSEVTWGADPFTGDFNFDFPADVDSLTFNNPIQLDGNNVEFYIPVGKTVYLPGGVSNPTASKSDQAGGQIKLTESTNRGTLVVNGLDKTRLGVKWGTVVVKGDPSVTKDLNYCYVWNWGNLVFDGGVYNCYGQIALDGNSISATNCTFHKVQNSARDGSIHVSHGTFRLKNCNIDSIGNCALKIGGIYSSQATHVGTFEWDGGTLGMGGGIIVGGTGTGTFNLKAGLVKSWEYTQDWPQIVGNSSTSVGNVNITGGEWQVQGTIWSTEIEERCAIYIGNSGTGTMTVSGTGVFSLYPRSYSESKNCKALLILAKNAGSTGTLNMNEGGTFLSYGRGAIGGEGTSRFVFNGGTFRRPSNATANYSFVESNVTTVAVGPKGGTVEVGNSTLKFYDPIVDLDPAAEPEGFFTKSGNGTLVMCRVSTYKVPTKVAAGTFDFTEGTPSNSTLYVDSGATALFSGTGPAAIGGVGTLAGTLANVSDFVFSGATEPGGANAVGTTSISCGNLSFVDGATLNVDIGAGGSDRLAVSGNVNLDNLTIELRADGGDYPDKIGPVLTCTGTLSGTPVVRPVSAGGKTLRYVASVHGGSVYACKRGFLIILR